MTIEHPRRLRAEHTLPRGLREALRELPNVAPEPAQLAALRRQLGIAAAVAEAPVQPLLVPDLRLKERRLRRTVVALLFFPVAATAAVGTVMDLHQRSVESAAAEAASATALARTRARRSAAALPRAANGADAPAVASTLEPEDLAPQSSPPAPVNLPRLPPAAPTSALASEHAEAEPHATDSRVATATELELLQRANAALKTEPAQALALAAQHRQLFPAGILAQEREVIAIKALVALGDSARARDSLTRFERAYPRSAHELELRQIVH
jgi:hypothetical protein